MQARLARTPRVRMVELVFTLLAPLMLHKEVSQQLVATPAMPMFRSIVGQNAEHFLVIRWLLSLPGVGGRENSGKSSVFHLGFCFSFCFLQVSITCLAVQSHGEFVILHLTPLGFLLGFVTFHHYLCMCDLWTPSPGLTNPSVVSGPAEGKNLGLICTMWDCKTLAPCLGIAPSTAPFPFLPLHGYKLDLELRQGVCAGIIKIIIFIPASPCPESV